ncbi:site-specific integrase [Paenibacillus sp. FSL H8-0168]|uniref:site-specific integrase n=1 Tax=Paenibacillus sp. FSL H8-0168 TaxID=2921378 RepID=UPI0031597731
MSQILAWQSLRFGPITVRRKGQFESREHLTRSEYEQYRSAETWGRVEPILSSSLTDLVQPTIFFKLPGTQRDYVLLLAFLQRISLPLEIVFPTKTEFNKFPFPELPNFEYFDALYDKYYPVLYPMDSEKQLQKAKKRIPLLRTVVCLWFAGYALKEGLEGNHIITSSVLAKASKIAKYHRSSLTLLGKMLAKETDSLIENKPVIPCDEAERSLWIAAGIYPTQTPFEESLYTFAFSYLRQRVNDSITDDYYDDEENLLFRYGKKTISINYWKAIVKYIRYFAIKCRSKGLTDISENSISEVYTEIFGQMKGQEDKTFFRVALRHWLRWLIRTTNASYNIERIMPRPRRVMSKDHGRVFSMSKAYILVQTLMNDQTPLINENILMNFRHRRACLLMLSTAARPHEIVNLLQNALFIDSQDNSWIRFHKTKTIRNQPDRNGYEWVHHALVKSDAARWFNELIHFAPSEPIFFPREWGGDGLTELRLLASKHNDGPIRTSGLYNFLTRIQSKLWPELRKPYFTPHNLRALHLTYRRILGDNDELLERQAGHSHPSSKKPYTETMPAEEVAKFGHLLQKGVWRKKPEGEDADKTEGAGISSTEYVAIDEITEISSKFEVTPQKLDEAYKLTQKIIEESPRFQGKVIDLEDELHEVNVGGYTHNCNAHVLLNCGHTPGHCRACDDYSPDEGTEDAHKADIFREMLHYYYCLDAEKNFKSTGQRKMVFQKAEDIKERLNKTERSLWVNKFKMPPNEAKKLHSLLFKKAKAYFREQSKEKPNPTNAEVLCYILSGELK